MIGKCESCGTSDVEVTISKENGKEKQICNQCRPPDGAYGYWWILLKQVYFYISLIFSISCMGSYQILLINYKYTLNLTNVNFNSWK